MSAARVSPAVVRATALARESPEDALDVLVDPERVDRRDPPDQEDEAHDGKEPEEFVIVHQDLP